jgi:hypothetical protein
MDSRFKVQSSEMTGGNAVRTQEIEEEKLFNVLFGISIFYL